MQHLDVFTNQINIIQYNIFIKKNNILTTKCSGNAISNICFHFIKTILVYTEKKTDECECVSYQISHEWNGFSFAKIRHTVNTVEGTAHSEKKIYLYTH